MLLLLYFVASSHARHKIYNKLILNALCQNSLSNNMKIS